MPKQTPEVSVRESILLLKNRFSKLANIQEEEDNEMSIVGMVTIFSDIECLLDCISEMLSNANDADSFIRRIIEKKFHEACIMNRFDEIDSIISLNKELVCKMYRLTPVEIHSQFPFGMISHLSRNHIIDCNTLWKFVVESRSLRTLKLYAESYPNDFSVIINWGERLTYKYATEDAFFCREIKRITGIDVLNKSNE